jgi:hypothetical protein
MGTAWFWRVRRLEKISRAGFRATCHSHPWLAARKVREYCCGQMGDGEPQESCTSFSCESGIVREPYPATDGTLRESLEEVASNRSVN